MCRKFLIKQLTEYQQFHTKLWTKVTHLIGVPLIIFSLITLTSWIHIRVPGFFDVPSSWLLSIIVLIYYFLLDVTLAAVITVFFLVFNLIISLLFHNRPSWISLQLFLYTFILGWVLLFIGHFIENKKPAFFKDIKFLLIAPMFLAADIFFHYGLKTDLKKSIEDRNLSA